MTKNKPKVNSVDKATRPQKNEDIARVVVEALKSGRYKFSAHALQRMEERQILPADVRDILLDGRREKRKDNFEVRLNCWSYAWQGKLDDGRQLRVPVSEIENGIIVITAIDLDRDE